MIGVRKRNSFRYNITDFYFTFFNQHIAEETLVDICCIHDRYHGNDYPSKWNILLGRNIYRQNYFTGFICN